MCLVKNVFQIEVIKYFFKKILILMVYNLNIVNLTTTIIS